MRKQRHSSLQASCVMCVASPEPSRPALSAPPGSSAHFCLGVAHKAWKGRANTLFSQGFSGRSPHPNGAACHRVSRKGISPMTGTFARIPSWDA
jgi:hypothetical protein